MPTITNSRCKREEEIESRTSILAIKPFSWWVEAVYGVEYLTNCTLISTKLIFQSCVLHVLYVVSDIAPHWRLFDCNFACDLDDFMTFNIEEQAEVDEWKAEKQQAETYSFLTWCQMSLG